MCISGGSGGFHCRGTGETGRSKCTPAVSKCGFTIYEATASQKPSENSRTFHSSRGMFGGIDSTVIHDQIWALLTHFVFAGGPLAGGKLSPRVAKNRRRQKLKKRTKSFSTRAVRCAEMLDARKPLRNNSASCINQRKGPRRS